MEISQDTLEVVKFLDYTTGNNLRKKDDMKIILELGARTGNYKLIESIIFTGSYLWKLHKTISNTNHSEGIDKLKQEAVVSSEDLRQHLDKLIFNVDDFHPKKFKDKYFPDDIGAFRNLIDLSHDLSRLKEMQITLKAEKKK